MSKSTIKLGDIVAWLESKGTPLLAHGHRNPAGDIVKGVCKSHRVDQAQRRIVQDILDDESKNPDSPLLIHRDLGQITSVGLRVWSKGSSDEEPVDTRPVEIQLGEALTELAMLRRRIGDLETERDEALQLALEIEQSPSTPVVVAETTTTTDDDCDGCTERDRHIAALGHSVTTKESELTAMAAKLAQAGRRKPGRGLQPHTHVMKTLGCGCEVLVDEAECDKSHPQGPIRIATSKDFIEGRVGSNPGGLTTAMVDDGIVVGMRISA